MRSFPCCGELVRKFGCRPVNVQVTGWAWAFCKSAGVCLRRFESCTCHRPKRASDQRVRWMEALGHYRLTPADCPPSPYSGDGRREALTCGNVARHMSHGGSRSCLWGSCAECARKFSHRSSSIPALTLTAHLTEVATTGGHVRTCGASACQASRHGDQARRPA